MHNHTHPSRKCDQFVLLQNVYLNNFLNKLFYFLDTMIRCCSGLLPKQWGSNIDYQCCHSRRRPSRLIRCLFCHRSFFYLVSILGCGLCFLLIIIFAAYRLLSKTWHPCPGLEQSLQNLWKRQRNPVTKKLLCLRY